MLTDAVWIVGIGSLLILCVPLAVAAIRGDRVGLARVRTWWFTALGLFCLAVAADMWWDPTHEGAATPHDAHVTAIGFAVGGSFMIGLAALAGTGKLDPPPGSPSYAGGVDHHDVVEDRHSPARRRLRRPPRLDRGSHGTDPGVFLAIGLCGLLGVACLGLCVWLMVNPPHREPLFATGRAIVSAFLAGVAFTGIAGAELVHRIRFGPQAPGHHVQT